MPAFFIGVETLRVAGVGVLDPTVPWHRLRGVMTEARIQSSALNGA
ncbi:MULTISPECIES: hypothetical protein [unclassified Synechococcus]|nr:MULTISPECIES: hypothetical protein [unclassified Synechococcus]